MSIQFIINNWYLFLALGVVLTLLVAAPLRQRLAGIRSLTPAEAIQVMNREDGVVVDVCEPKEFASGHIVHALNIPLSNLSARVGELEEAPATPYYSRLSQRQPLAPGGVFAAQAGFHQGLFARRRPVGLAT